MATLLHQLRAQYPEASLTAELISIHDGCYIVRASAIQAGQALASALASGSQVEVAEDKAYTRLLEMLGIASSQSTKSQRAGSIEIQTNGQVNQPAVDSSSKSTNGGGIQSAKDSSSKPAAVMESVEDTSGEADMAPPIDTVVEEPLEVSAETDLASIEGDQPKAGAAAQTADPAHSSAAAIAMENFSASAPRVDLSDVIAQTDVELMRLGWTNEQGRDYLQKTYGKISRQQLTDEELMGFLLYLEEQQTS